MLDLGVDRGLGFKDWGLMTFSGPESGTQGIRGEYQEVGAPVSKIPEPEV